MITLKPTNSYRSQNKTGFSLIEMLIVLALIGLIAGLAIGDLGSILGGGKEKVAESFVNSSMEIPLTSYKLNLGNYPSSAEMKDFAALLTAPTKKADRWKGPYIKNKKGITDPWGNNYRYRYPGAKNPGGYDLWSIGPDETDSTADDIGNW